MCIIIDTNTFGDFLKLRKLINHKELTKEECARFKSNNFYPVHNWVHNGKGKFIWGGSKYKGELAKVGNMLRYFKELSYQNKVIKINSGIVDQEQEEVLRRYTGRSKKFNDPHLIAIAIVSGCRLICTNEEDACEYIKDKSLYPNSCKIPKIYKNRNHKRLLCDAAIIKIQNID